MNKKFTSVFSVLILVVFIIYIIFDTSRPAVTEKKEETNAPSDTLTEKWKISDELQVTEGSLKAVTVSPSGKIFLGGDSFVSCYNSDLTRLWSIETPSSVTSLSNSGDTLFASTVDVILIIGINGTIEDEWGPFEDKSFITSVSSNKTRVAYADAGNRMIVILDKDGRVEKIIGQGDGQFVLPSPYFDVAFDTNYLYVANTGHRRIEKRSAEGRLLSMFGEPGMAPGAFCGCCNPAHFIVTPNGFITSEKGINRIKVLGKSGEFVEFVTNRNRFVASIPLDLASADGNILYAANPADSKLYVFRRK
jgi:hypothetical protein